MARGSKLFETKITFTIGGALALLVIVLFGTYIMVPESHQGAVIFFGAALTVAGALATAFYTGRVLSLQVMVHEQSPQDIAFRFSERWNDPQMFHTRDACRQIMDMLSPTVDAARAKDELEADEVMRRNLRPILNFLEELALAIRTERADQEITRRFFAGIVTNVFLVTEEWIKDQRAHRKRPQLWVEFEWLYKTWRSL